MEEFIRFMLEPQTAFLGSFLLLIVVPVFVTLAEGKEV